MTPTSRSGSSATPSPSRAPGRRASPFFHAVADASGSLRGDADGAAPDRARRVRIRLLSARRRSCWPRPMAAARGSACRASRAMSSATSRRKRSCAAAQAGGCDLIFMASHGRHGKLGMALVSEMLEVLMNARLPVLVSSIGEPACAGASDRHHPRRAPFAGCGDARLDARPRRGAPGGHRRRSGADAGDRSLRAPVSGRAAPSQGRRAPVPPAARAHRQLRCRARRARAPAPARSRARRRARAPGRSPGSGRRRCPRASHARARGRR